MYHKRILVLRATLVKTLVKTILGLISLEEGIVVWNVLLPTKREQLGNI